MSIHKNSREQARLQHISVNFTGGLERALFAQKTSPRHYAAATRIKDVVQFSLLMILPPQMIFEPIMEKGRALGYG